MIRHSLPSVPWSALAFAFASAAAAPAQADPRLATHLYQANEIVTVRGGSETQTTIAFAPDERIENIAVGDSASWQVTPNKRADLLFLKPIRVRARTNMTVITDQRTYLFDLLGEPRGAGIYMLRFTYPDAPRAAPASPPSSLVEAAALAETSAATPPAPDPAALNFAWVGEGDQDLLPARAFDDGRSTYLAWAADVALPAILMREPGGAEGPVNYTVKGEYIVVDGVPAQLVLRSAKRTATLTPAARQPSSSRVAVTTPARAERPSVKPQRRYRPGPWYYATFAAMQP